MLFDSGIRFRVQGSGFKVQRFRVQGSGFKVQRFRVQGSEVPGSMFRGSGLGLRFLSIFSDFRIRAAA
jgi:hypothetical protein